MWHDFGMHKLNDNHIGGLLLNIYLCSLNLASYWYLGCYIVLVLFAMEITFNVRCKVIVEFSGKPFMFLSVYKGETRIFTEVAMFWSASQVNWLIYFTFNFLVLVTLFIALCVKLFELSSFIAWSLNPSYNCVFTLRPSWTMRHFWFYAPKLWNLGRECI